MGNNGKSSLQHESLEPTFPWGSRPVPQPSPEPTHKKLGKEKKKSAKKSFEENWDYFSNSESGDFFCPVEWKLVATEKKTNPKTGGNEATKDAIKADKKT